MADKTAAIIAGPRWWGEVQTDRNGEPTLRENQATRKAQAKREREIMQEIVNELPEDCFVIQGGARGADSLAFSLCNTRGIHGAGVPYFGSKGRQGGYLRNQMMALLLNGLKLQGFKVKVVVVQPPEGLTTGTKMMADIAEKAGIYVKYVVYTEETEPTDAA